MIFLCCLFWHKTSPFLFSLIALYFQGLHQGAKNKYSLVGTVVLNLAEFAGKPEEESNLDIPLPVSGSTSEFRLSLNVCLFFLLLMFLIVYSLVVQMLN